MTYSRINSSAATLTKNRTEGSVTPLSGMCVTCVDGCIGMCEIGKSAYRAHEVLYPQHFGVITTAAEKNYPVDYSHFNIMGTVVGASGIEFLDHSGRLASSSRVLEKKTAFFRAAPANIRVISRFSCSLMKPSWL